MTAGEPAGPVGGTASEEPPVGRPGDRLAAAGNRLAGAALRAAYNGLILPSARALLPAAGVLDPKLAAFRRARRNWRGALRESLAARPDVAAGDALWVHAASAGEFLQARALLAALRSALPQLPLVYTYTSPSTVPLLGRFRGADLVFPLPLDTPENARDWFDTVRPAALALVDAELWPNFLGESSRRSVPAALVSARLGTRSRRSRFPVRAFYRDLYRRLDLVGAVDGESARRFREAGVPAARVRVTGDLRIDETLRRGAAVRERAPLPLPGILPLVVAGSTWPDDEAVLLPALEALRDRGVCLALALAPHEVGERRLEKLEGALEAAGFTPVRWSRNAEAELSVDGDFSGKAGAGLFPKKDRPVGPSAAPAPRDAEARALRGLVGSSGFPPSTEARTAADALVIDRVGLLYRLYFGAAAAYVGGGFGGALHNVMEPAVFGVPVVTGPRTRRSWIAREMVRAGGLFPVADPSACAAVLEHLLAGGPSAVAAGRRARDVLAAHGGATERTLEALREAGWLAQGDTAAATPPKKWSGGTLSS